MSPISYSIEDVRKYVNDHKELLEFNNDLLNPHPEKQKFDYLKELLHFYSFRTPCQKAVNELKRIIENTDDLNTEFVRTWVDENVLFFKENLFNLGYSYVDEDGENDKDFYLSKYNLFVENKEFIPIIYYWQLMWILYFSQYFKPIEERDKIEPDPNDYYYVKPDPNAPSDLEVIKSILVKP